MAPLPSNTTNPVVISYGTDLNPNCSPATAWSIFLFFLTNYLAHVVTVKMYPGSSSVDAAVATAFALLIPSSGIIRALFAILRHPRFKRGRNTLEKAAAAAALLMVIRNDDWVPEAGDRIKMLPLGNDHDSHLHLATLEKSVTKLWRKKQPTYPRRKSPETRFCRFRAMKTRISQLATETLRAAL